MNTRNIILAAAIAALAVVLIVSGIWVTSASARFRYGMFGPAMMGAGNLIDAGGNNWGGACSNTGTGSWGSGSPTCPLQSLSPNDFVGSLEKAKQTFQDYIDSSYNSNLAIIEVMEFEKNFYAIAVENSTGIGAFELLLDKETGLVGYEPGPNMMWNDKYGMHAGTGMKSWRSDIPDGYQFSNDEIVSIAQEWLDAHLPGRQAGDPDPFYGYYTLHYFKDGVVDGMLSVNAYTGDVWQHSWHGEFIAMIEDDNEG